MIEKCFLLLCLLLSVQGQAFAGLNLDPSLVASTNNAISNLRGVLTLYSCSGNTYSLFYAGSSKDRITFKVCSTLNDTSSIPSSRQ